MRPGDVENVARGDADLLLESPHPVPGEGVEHLERGVVLGDLKLGNGLHPFEAFLQPPGPPPFATELLAQALDRCVFRREFRISPDLPLGRGACPSQVLLQSLHLAVAFPEVFLQFLDVTPEPLHHTVERHHPFVLDRPFLDRCRRFGLSRGRRSALQVREDRIKRLAPEHPRPHFIEVDPRPHSLHDIAELVLEAPECLQGR
ncbi:hypothetical protein DSECCO2_612750 [anaerobic digester metagenome]